MRPALFLVTCLAAVPLVVAVSTALTVAWYEAVWLPAISGDD